MREAAWAGASSTQKRSLIPKRDAAEVGRFAVLEPHRGEARLVARPLGGQRRDGVERVRRFGRGEAGLGQLDGADLAGAQRPAGLGDGEGGKPAHSTTFGTVKKPARASGAFSSTLSGWPPSVTTSCAPVELHRRHRGHRLHALDVDLAQLLHEAEDPRELRRQGAKLGLGHLDPRQVRHPARGFLVDRHAVSGCWGVPGGLYSAPLPRARRRPRRTPARVPACPARRSAGWPPRLSAVDGRSPPVRRPFAFAPSLRFVGKRRGPPAQAMDRGEFTGLLGRWLEGAVQEFRRGGAAADHRPLGAAGRGEDHPDARALRRMHAERLPDRQHLDR